MKKILFFRRIAGIQKQCVNQIFLIIYFQTLNFLWTRLPSTVMNLKCQKAWLDTCKLSFILRPNKWNIKEKCLNFFKFFLLSEMSNLVLMRNSTLGQSAPSLSYQMVSSVLHICVQILRKLLMNDRHTTYLVEIKL